MRKNNIISFHRTVCCLVLIVLFIPRFFVYAAAAGRTVTIKDLGIDCTIPDYFTYVFTRDNISDTDAASLGMTKTEIKNLLTESNAYLEAGTEYFETDLRITMVPITIGDFSDYGDGLLNGLASEMVDSLKSYGYSNITWEIYHHPDTVFLKMEYSLPSDTGYLYSIQYYTVMNLQAINFTCSFSSKPSSSDKSMVKGIVDSAIFKNAPVKESEEDIKRNHPAFDFTDNFVSFQIPAGWTQEPTDPNHKLINAKFQKVGLSEMLITYGCQDLWAQLSTTEKQGSKRSDLSFSAMTDQEIREIVTEEYAASGATLHNISIETVGGKKYYQVVMTVRNETYGIPLDVTNTQMVFLENGYMVSFSFSQEPSSQYYSEFIDVLESVTFRFLEENDNGKNGNSASSASEQSTTASASSEANQADTITFLRYLPYIIGGVVIVALVVVIVIQKKRIAAEKTQAARNYQLTYQKEPILKTEASQILFCHKCGARLDAGETICKKCGTVIPR